MRCDRSSRERRIASSTSGPGRGLPVRWDKKFVLPDHAGALGGSGFVKGQVFVLAMLRAELIGNLRRACARSSGSAWCSKNALAFRGLPREQKCLDQLAVAAHGHGRKTLVPLAVWHIGLRVEPCREQPKLCRGDLPALNAVEQMLKQRGRKILSADFRHGRQIP
jgi:hypothetical protein